MSDIPSNIETIMKRISEAAANAGRDPSEILLLAVSKTMPAQPIRATFEAGQVHFGENRVQEAREKIPGLPGGIVML